MKTIILKWHKMRNWEYWPMQAVYYPIMPVWLFLAIRARSFFFFNAANPTIKNGGMAMESKKEIYDIMPSESIPKTIYFTGNRCADTILKAAAMQQIDFPFIVKPDVGMKGLAVQIIKDKDELEAYLKKSTDDLLVQELVEFKNEVGIFYCRIPGESNGKITGIVHKKNAEHYRQWKRHHAASGKEKPKKFFPVKGLAKDVWQPIADGITHG